MARQYSVLCNWGRIQRFDVCWASRFDQATLQITFFNHRLLKAVRSSVSRGFALRTGGSWSSYLKLRPTSLHHFRLWARFPSRLHSRVVRLWFLLLLQVFWVWLDEKSCGWGSFRLLIEQLRRRSSRGSIRSLVIEHESRSWTATLQLVVSMGGVLGLLAFTPLLFLSTRLILLPSLLLDQNLLAWGAQESIQ